jgi:hypothetical protein
LSAEDWQLRTSSNENIGSEDAYFDRVITIALLETSPTLLSQADNSGVVRFDLDCEPKRKQHMLKRKRKIGSERIGVFIRVFRIAGKWT